MVHAKNDETLSTFAEVMRKKPWPLFFRTRCTCTLSGKKKPTVFCA